MSLAAGPRAVASWATMPDIRRFHRSRHLRHPHRRPVVSQETGTPPGLTQAGDSGSQRAFDSPEIAETARLLRAERTMVGARWFGVIFALVQVLTYYLPYPPGTLQLALAAIALLALGNGVAWAALRRSTTLNGLRRLSVGTLLLNSTVFSILVFVYTFDTETAIWAVLYILPLEAAIRFQLKGALWTMSLITLMYTVRELYGARVYGNEFLVVSISFRMGIGFIIAGIAGAIARGLARDREQFMILNRITQTTRSAGSIPMILDSIAREIARLFRVEVAAVALFDGDRRQLVVKADHASDPNVASLVGVAIPVDGASPAGLAMAGRRAVFVTDLAGATMTDRMRDPGARSRARGLMVAPLLSRDEAFGAIIAETGRGTRSFSPADLALAETAAGQVAGAIVDAKYLEQVGHVVDAATAVEDDSFDPAMLSGVAKRPDALGNLARVFQRMATQVMDRQRRLRQEVGALRIEINQARAEREAAEITESDYFVSLQRKVEGLRGPTAP